jgi:hypothetical protein
MKQRYAPLRRAAAIEEPSRQRRREVRTPYADEQQVLISNAMQHRAPMTARAEHRVREP